MLGTLSYWKHFLTERNPLPLQNTNFRITVNFSVITNLIKSLFLRIITILENRKSGICPHGLGQQNEERHLIESTVLSVKWRGLLLQEIQFYCQVYNAPPMHHALAKFWGAGLFSQVLNGICAYLKKTMLWMVHDALFWNREIPLIHHMFWSYVYKIKQRSCVKSNLLTSAINNWIAHNSLD